MPRGPTAVLQRTTKHRFMLEGGTCSLIPSLLSITCKLVGVITASVIYQTIGSCMINWLNHNCAQSETSCQTSKMTDCNVRKRKQVLFESTMHPNVSHIFCCLQLVLYYRFPCDQKHSSKKKKKDIWVQISSLYGHYLLIFTFIPGPLSHVTKMSSEKQMARRSVLNYTFPCLLEKQVLEITRKVIFTVACSSVMCPAKSQLRWAKLLRVGRRTRVCQTHGEGAFTSVNARIRAEDRRPVVML